MPLISSRTRLILALLLATGPGCALYNSSQDDPDAGGGFDLIEADMAADMPSDMSDPLDMEDMHTPDMDMAVDMRDMAEMPVDMPPDMMPACADYAGSDEPQLAVAVAVGEAFSCALLADKTVKCWGDDQYGQLGDGVRLPRSAPTKRVTGLCEPAVAIGAGAYHACAVLESGKVACWGLGNLGQLGDGRAGGNNSSVKMPVSTTAVEVLDITNAKRVYGGEYYSCALLKTDDVYCWGRNHRGQLGVGNTTQQLRPKKISLGSITFSQLSTGENTACALLSDGSARCWGRNEFGELGVADTSDAIRPMAVPGLTEPTRLASGKSITCALGRDAGTMEMPGTNMLAALCWGALGKFNGMADTDVNLVKTPIPTPILRTEDAQELYVGESFACALHTDGQVSCWGLNGSYQLGNSSNGGTEMIARVELPGGVVIDTTDDTKMDIEATGSHACAVTIQGEVYCWGTNEDKQLGINGVALSPPTKITGL
jgi:alpha-tubulin suppressor-like RCC1 family protein